MYDSGFRLQGSGCMVWWLDQLSLEEPTWVKAKEKSHMTPAEAAQKSCPQTSRIPNHPNAAQESNSRASARQPVALFSNCLNRGTSRPIRERPPP